MEMLTERERVVQILHAVQALRDALSQAPCQLTCDQLTPDPLTTTRIAAVSGWLLQRQPHSARQWLEDHAEALCTPYTIALLMAMLTNPEAGGIEAELCWRRDLLLCARRHGIAIAWQLCAQADAP